jgi:predicted rRNA methylase YqxC with S4 and FtsJ domains
MAIRIEFAYCSAKQLYNYVHNYDDDDKTVMQKYHELQPYVSGAASKLKSAYDQFSLISGGKSIPEYYEGKCPI